MRVGVISDASLASDRRRVLALSLALKGALSADLFLSEPDQRDDPPQHACLPDLAVHRLSTPTDPHGSGTGRIDYARAAAALADRLRPELLVVVSTFAMPALLFLKRRPRFTVFHAVEPVVECGPADVILSQVLRKSIDFIIWPDQSHRERDAAAAGFTAIPCALVMSEADGRPRDDPFGVLAQEIAARFRARAAA